MKSSPESSRRHLLRVLAAGPGPVTSSASESQLEEESSCEEMAEVVRLLTARTWAESLKAVSFRSRKAAMSGTRARERLIANRPNDIH